MKIRVKSRDMNSDDAVINYVENRLAFAFARTQHEIDDATITLSDVNGPKGGDDKQCQIVLKVARLQPVVISETRESWREAIDRCLYRANQRLNRKLKRRQVLRKKGYQKAQIFDMLSAPDPTST